MDSKFFQYSFLMKVLHWSMAFLILALLCIGFSLDDLEGLEKGFWIMIHKSCGMLVGVLLIFRIIERLRSDKPPVDENKYIHILSLLTVLMLYASMIGMFLSGYLMSSFAGYSVNFFNMFEIPSFISKDMDAAKLSNQIHGVIPIMLVFALCLHIAGSLFHFFIRKDQVLQRMLPNRWSCKINKQDR